MERIRKIAQTQEGECLSEVYINANTKLEFLCKEGHVFEKIPYNIEKGAWCNECNGQAKWTLDKVKELAESKGGECLSVKYVGFDHKLDWKCGNEHKWQGTLHNAIKYWCDRCSNNIHKLNMDDIHRLSRSNGGECLSTECSGAWDVLKWRCKIGHEWKSSQQDVRRYWCRACNKIAFKQDKLNKLQKIAQSKLGNHL